MKLRWVNPIRIVKEWAHKNPAISRLLHWMDSFRFWITPFFVRANQRIQNRVVPFLKKANARHQEFRMISQYAFPFIAAGVLFVYGYAMYGMLGAAMLALAAYFVSILIVTMLPYGPIIIGLVLLGSIARGVTMFTLLKGPPDQVCATCGTSWESNYIQDNHENFAWGGKQIVGCPHPGCNYWVANNEEPEQQLRDAAEQTLLMNLINPNGKTITKEDCTQAVGRWIKELESKRWVVQEKNYRIDRICRMLVSHHDDTWSLRQACADYVDKLSYECFADSKTTNSATLLLYSEILKTNLLDSLNIHRAFGNFNGMWDDDSREYLEIQARNILSISKEGDVLALHRQCELGDSILSSQQSIINIFDAWRSALEKHETDSSASSASQKSTTIFHNEPESNYEYELGGTWQEELSREIRNWAEKRGIPTPNPPWGR